MGRREHLNAVEHGLDLVPDRHSAQLVQPRLESRKSLK